MGPNRDARAAREGGFSLVEILAVIAILGILAVILIPRLLGGLEAAKEKEAQAWLAQIGGAVAEYENRFGDFPPSAWIDEWGVQPNSTNVGAEALVLCLWSPKWGGTALPDDQLVNADDDEGKKPLSRLAANDLFELEDPWGNPIAYLHRRDYEKVQTYVTIDPETGDVLESQVSARKNPQTKLFFEPTRFQLISAGPDGLFGTEDDLASFRLPEED